MPHSTYYDFGKVLPTPLNTIDNHQHVYEFNSDSFETIHDQLLEKPHTNQVIEKHDSFQYSNLHHDNFEESGQTMDSFTANGLQDRLKIQYGVYKFVQFVIHEDEIQSSLDEIAQTLDDDFIPADTNTNILGTLKSSPNSDTGKPYDETLKRSLKSNLKVLNEFAKPATHSPTGLNNVAKIDQMIHFAKEQKVMDKIKKNKSHFYRAYWQRRLKLGWCDPSDLVSNEELRFSILSSELYNWQHL